MYRPFWVVIYRNSSRLRSRIQSSVITAVTEAAIISNAGSSGSPVALINHVAWHWRDPSHHTHTHTHTEIK
jgi:hypothetical protein